MSREMVDSGIEWMRKIPFKWNKTRLKDNFIFEKGKNAALYTSEYISYNTGTYPVYSGQTENNGIMGMINSFDYDVDECLFTTTVGAKVMTIKKLYNKFSLSQNCLIMKKFKKNININYYYYLLQSLFEYEKTLIPSYMQPSLRIEDLNKYKFYIPSGDEQEKIANYLDKKVKLIDETIENNKKEIELLEEYKRSTIIDLTFHGFEKNNLKDSKIDYVGKIPQYWKICNLFEYVNENKVKNKNMINNNLLSLSYGKIIRKDINSNEGLLPEKFETYQIISPNSIVLRLTDLQNDKKSLRVGHCYEEGIITSAYINLILNSKEISSEYLYYLLHSYDLCKVFYKMGSGVRQSLNYNELKRMKILVPPIDEQIKICNELDLLVKNVEEVIDYRQSIIDKLEEYKKSLIYEAVTGKIEV